MMCLRMGWSHSSCRFRTCPPGNRACEICKNLQNRRCSSCIGPELYQNEIIMSPCGLPAQLTLQAALHPEDREDILGVESEAVYFWAAGPADIMVEIGLLDAAKHDQYVLDVAAGVAATEDEAWQNMQLCTTHDGKALLMQCGFEQASADVQYCVQFHSQPSTVRLDCCIRDNSQSLRLGPRGMLKVLARVCHKDTKQVLARLVSTSFNVTSSRSKYNRNGSALPLLQSDPVGRLRGVGAETEKRLLDPHGFVMYYQVTEDDTVLPPHCVAYLASVTTVGDFKELEVWMDREWPECPRALRNALLPPSAIDQLELSPALPKDERMRRWRSSYGQELLFAAKQAVVSAQNLTAVAEPVSCYGQQTMKITAISRFDTDLADRVERLQGTAMEQLFGDNHLGWDVPGAHSSLFSFLDEIPAGDSVRVPIMPDIVRHIAQDVMGAVKGLFDMSQLQDALCAVYISTSSRGDPRLKWQEIRLNKASDLGHCICLDGDPDFGLNHEGDPHCLARVPRGRGGYRFARSRAGLISAHFEYKDREFAAHEFEIVTNLHEFVWRRASPSFTGAIEVGRDSKGRPTYAAMCKSTHGVEGSSSRPHHYIPGRAQAHLSYAAYCWASCGYKADLSDCYVLCQR
ncbi:hypothetical protein WJX79_000397 [Trebouxia sp. C0005]